MTSVGARGGDAPDTVGTMQAVPTAPDLADSGAATAPSSLLDRTRDVWLPIVLYLAIRERRPNRANPTGQIAGWKNILNVLTMTYGDRLRFN